LTLGGALEVSYMKKIELSSLNARECQRYSETVKVKGENFLFESMPMALIILQQRMIKQLIGELSNKKNDQFKLPF
jgi:hypothetical protein